MKNANSTLHDDSVNVPLTRNMLRSLLQESPYNVTFIKADGQVRKMKSVLMDKFIPAEHLPKGLVAPEDPEGNTLRAYDMEAEGWRTITVDRVVALVKAND